MNKLMVRLGAVAAVALVSACGGGKSTQVGSTNGLPFSTGQTADLTTLASQGNITVRSGAAEYTTAGSFSAQLQSLTLDVNSVNSIDVSFGGASATLTRAGGAGPFTGSIGGSTLTATVDTDTSLFFGQISQNRGTTINDSETFFVTGFETNPANLSGTATFNGDVEMAARNRVGGVPDAGTTQVMDGTFAMTVNFGTNDLTAGSMSGLDDEGNTVTLTLAPVNFGGFNSFTTTATKSGTSDLAMGSVSVRGGFYGPTGNQVGGILYGNITAGMPSGEPTSAAGYFEGSR